MRDLYCYNCGSLEHWVDECPELSSEQQAQLHMAVEGNEEQEEVKEGHQLMNVTLMQGTALPENRAYLDGCSTVTEKIRPWARGLRVMRLKTYWPWPGRSPMVGPPLFVMIK